jgi:hypothetical protein
MRSPKCHVDGGGMTLNQGLHSIAPGMIVMATFRRFAIKCLLTCSVLLAACANTPAVVDHAFSFDVIVDSPGYEVISYRYGEGRFHTTSSDSAIRQFGRSHQATGINGPMPLGDSLYVKWRKNSTGQTYEKTIDLKSRLPTHMTNQRIHFVVSEGEIYVYLIDPLPRPPDWPSAGPKKFQYEKVRQIHP